MSQEEFLPIVELPNSLKASGKAQYREVSETSQALLTEFCAATEPPEKPGPKANSPSKTESTAKEVVSTISDYIIKSVDGNGVEQERRRLLELLKDLQIEEPGKPVRFDQKKVEDLRSALKQYGFSVEVKEVEKLKPEDKQIQFLDIKVIKNDRNVVRFSHKDFAEVNSATSVARELATLIKNQAKDGKMESQDARFIVLDLLDKVQLTGLISQGASFSLSKDGKMIVYDTARDFPERIVLPLHNEEDSIALLNKALKPHGYVIERRKALETKPYEGPYLDFKTLDGKRVLSVDLNDNSQDNINRIKRRTSGKEKK